jgi:7,8-dihydropterin-6-yl-methyl-4-(beta-D-ribofuranosyl)aminobenzene 5'-phosphate synthase
VTEIYEGIFMTGPIPRTTPYEDVGGRFFLDDACTQPDPLADDQALFIESPQGINVILGCAHAGVVNTLQYIQQVTKGKPIHTVMGGMHLLAASPDRIDQTIAALRQMGVQRIGPAHCTGCAATAALWTAFPGKCFSCSTGSGITLEIDETES